MPLMTTLGALATQKTSNIIVPGSRYFNGAGTPIALEASPPSSLLNDLTATSGYTLEYWVRYVTLGSGNGIQIGDINTGFTTYWDIGVFNGSFTYPRAFRFTWRQISAFPVISNFIQTQNNVISSGAWYSIALVLSNSGGNTTIQLFINGIAQNIQLNLSGSFLPSITVASSTFEYSGGNYWGIKPTASSGSTQQVYFDEMRVSNIARYTSNYTPATSPFTPDINTNLLWHFNYDTLIGANSPVVDYSQNNFGYINANTIAVSSPAKF